MIAFVRDTTNSLKVVLSATLKLKFRKKEALRFRELLLANCACASQSPLRRLLEKAREAEYRLAHSASQGYRLTIRGGSNILPATKIVG